MSRFRVWGLGCREPSPLSPEYGKGRSISLSSLEKEDFHMNPKSVHNGGQDAFLCPNLSALTLSPKP